MPWGVLLDYMHDFFKCRVVCESVSIADLTLHAVGDERNNFNELWVQQLLFIKKKALLVGIVTLVCLLHVITFLFTHQGMASVLKTDNASHGTKGALQLHFYVLFIPAAALLPFSKGCCFSESGGVVVFWLQEVFLAKGILHANTKP